jgi:hypothetical protein
MRRVVRGSLFVAFIGVINLGSSIAIPAAPMLSPTGTTQHWMQFAPTGQHHRLLLAASRLFTSRSMML